MKTPSITIGNLTENDLTSIIRAEMASVFKQLPLVNPIDAPAKLTTGEAARYLNVAIGTIYNLRSKGIIPSHKPPGSGRVYCYRHELDEWIIQQKEKKDSNE